MTGYASAQLSGANGPAGPEDKPMPTGRLGVEIRAVNSRFLDLSFRLSEDLRQHEPALRELLQSRLKRGKVEVRAAVETAGAEGFREPSSRQLQRLNSLQDTVRSWLPQAQPLSVADVLRLSGAEDTGGNDWGPSLSPAAGQALTPFLHARAPRRGPPVLQDPTR